MYNACSQPIEQIKCVSISAAVYMEMTSLAQEYLKRSKYY